MLVVDLEHELGVVELLLLGTTENQKRGPLRRRTS